MRGTTGQDSCHLRGGTHEKNSSRVHLLPAAQPELACDIPCLCVCTTDARDADVRRDDTERTPTTIETELRLSKHTTAITTTADVMCASEHTKAQ